MSRNGDYVERSDQIRDSERDLGEAVRQDIYESDRHRRENYDPRNTLSERRSLAKMRARKLVSLK